MEQNLRMIGSGQHAGMSARDLVLGVVELASPPAIYARLTRLMDDPRSTAADLAAVLENDPALTARLLKIVNSALYGFPAQIGSVSRAITLVGTQELRDLVLATTVMETFSGLPNELVTMQDFWRQSLRCAVLSKVIVEHQRGEVAADSVFVAGLLHELGHLIIYRKLPELAREAILRHKHSGIALHRAEQEVLGFDYAAVGAELLRLWNLPLYLQETVAYHLRPESATRFPRETAIVHLASRIAALDSFAADEVTRDIPEMAPLWKTAGVRTGELATLLNAAEAQYQVVVQVFS